MKNTKMGLGFFSLTALLSAAGVSLQAGAFPVQLNVSWSPSFAQVQVVNNQSKTIDCSGKIEAVTYNGLRAVQPFYFTNLDAGQGRFAYISAGSYAFSNAYAAADCQFSDPGSFPEPDPKDLEPVGNVVASGNLSGLNGIGVSGTVKIYETGVNQYALRVENVSGIPREPGLELQAQVDSYYLGETYMRAAGGSQNFPINNLQLPSGIHQWIVRVYSSVKQLAYAEANLF